MSDINKLAKAQNLLVMLFDSLCDIDGCMNTAEHLATFTQGESVEECQLCNQHYIELSRKLTQAKTQEETP